MPAESGVEAIRAACEAMKEWRWCDQENSPISETGERGRENGYDLSQTGFLGIGELRCVHGDSAWLSPSQSRNTVSIHLSFSGHPDRHAETERELLGLERALAKYN